MVRKTVPFQLFVHQNIQGVPSGWCDVRIKVETAQARIRNDNIGCDSLSMLPIAIFLEESA